MVAPLGSDLDDVYSLVVSIRFLERKAFDTLANLVDPRGGYILLSTFVEEEQPNQQHSIPAAAAPRAGQRAQGVGAGGIGGKGGTDGVAGSTDKAIQNGGDTSFEKGDARAGLENGSRKEASAGGKTGVGHRVKGRGGARGATGSGATGGRKKISLKKGAIAAAAAAAEAAAIMARWPHETPRDASKILRRGELARVFGGRHGFEILEDSVERLPDGRPISCFLARKVSDSYSNFGVSRLTVIVTQWQCMGYMFTCAGRSGACRVCGIRHSADSITHALCCACTPSHLSRSQPGRCVLLDFFWSWQSPPDLAEESIIRKTRTPFRCLRRHPCLSPFAVFECFDDCFQVSCVIFERTSTIH